MALQVRIASPCSAKWEDMKGDERTRFCAQCKLDVFNIREMSESDARALLFKGRVCGRVYQRPDGTVLTNDCPTGLAKLRRRALAAVTMAAAMVLVGVRFMSKRECSTSGESNWFGNTFGQRYSDAKEALRETQTFGPIINELDPQHVMAGDMVMVPSAPTGG